jgi:NADPH:quinone reductase-like Zn-dependent oxidoreductase
MKAVLINHQAVGQLEIGDVDVPDQQPGETLVAVKAFSLNRGDLKRTEVGQGGDQAGWDFSGIVESAAPDGSGPASGARVVGMSRRREGFAELVSVPTLDVAAIPDGVSFTDAAALPVAGLTALYSLERCERLLGSNVLITGASGGVGVLACQLAVHMGAHVYGQIRNVEHESLIASTGATPVLTADGSAVSECGPFRSIIDGVGGSLLAKVLPSLSEDGRAVLYGFTESRTAEFGIADLIFTGAGRIEGFYLFRETEFESCAKGLARLSQLVDAELLNCHVNVIEDWAKVGTVAADLSQRRFAGKATLTI